MSKKKFIQECLEKLEDLNSFQVKGGVISTGEFNLKDFTDNLLPILKDLVEENIELKDELKRMKEAEEEFTRKGMHNFKIGGTD